VILERRALLRLAGLAAALPLIRPAPALALAVFAPPAAPMRYTRRLERGLPDGARLTVSRSFAVRFVPEAGGFRIDGTQAEVAVEAPAALESLARLERERVETGVFPLRLDAAGAIRAVAPSAASAQLDAAVREVTARIEQGQHTPAEREQLRAFVDAVHRSAGRLVTELPHDLFAPVDCPRAETRAIALPGGGEGQVRTSFDAEVDPATGLMRAARREVVTEVSGDVRRTVESWSLALL
jgi:hypothetical protein